MARTLHTVFVYGTLKKGEPNHHWFAKDNAGHSEFICEAQTVDKYPLIIATKYNIPFLLFAPGDGNNVRGELYKVDDKVFTNLDQLEDHPQFYIREVERFRRLDNGEEIRAWVYFIKNFREDLLAREMFSCYSNDGPHGLKYVESEQSTIDDL